MKISQITPIVIAQMFLCFKMRSKSLSLKSVLKWLLKYSNSVDKVKCFSMMRSTTVNSCLSGSGFFTRSYQLQCNPRTRRQPPVTIKTRKLQQYYDNFQVTCISFFKTLSFACQPHLLQI